MLAALFIAISLWGVFAVRRSYPKIKGTVSIAGLIEKVEVFRDNLGVAQIYASNEHDPFIAQGYVHAQDRFFQMDLWRHMGEGRVAEMFGESMVGTDRYLRTMGWTQTAKDELQQLDSDSLFILQAYAEGVNAYLSDHAGAKISLEYVVLGLLTPVTSPPPGNSWIPSLGQR